MRREFRVGGIVWRGYRYWSGLSLLEQSLLGNPATGDYSGWNTTFVPYSVLAFTRKRIKVMLLPDSINGTEATEKDREPLFLDRATMERDGKQYHARYHEYFYAVKPKSDPEHRHSSSETIGVFNLPVPYTKADVRRAYKRLAHDAHPDHGGSESAFIELKKAHDEALRGAI